MNILSPKDRFSLGLVLAVNLVCLPIGFGRDYFELQQAQRVAAEHARALARDAHRHLEQAQALGRYDVNYLSDAGPKPR